MTTPVETDDLLSGAAQYLLSLPDVVAVVGAFPDSTPYIWQETPGINFEREATVGIVVTTSAIGISDDAHTQHFERLGIEFWVGPIRDSVSGQVVEPAETRRRLMAAYRKVDRYLHRTNPSTQYWGTVRTHSSERIGEIDRYSPEDGKEILIGQVFYVVQLD